MFKRIDDKMFNTNHITFVGPIVSLGQQDGYRIKVCSNPEIYDCRTIYDTEDECWKAIRGFLGISEPRDPEDFNWDVV